MNNVNDDQHPDGPPGLMSGKGWWVASSGGAGPTKTVLTPSENRQR